MHRGAVTPKWRTDRADTRPPRALLLPQLLARTGNLPASLSRMRAAVLPGAVVLHRLPDQIFIHRTENLIGKIESSDLLTAQIMYVNSCHVFAFLITDPWPLITGLRLLRCSLRCL